MTLLGDAKHHLALQLFKDKMDSSDDIFITQDTFSLDNTVDTVKAGDAAEDLCNLNIVYKQLF